jgi:hypothetical protein
MALNDVPAIAIERQSSAGRRLFENFGPNRLNAHLRAFAGRVFEGPGLSDIAGARLAPVVRYKKGFFTGGVFDGTGFLPHLALYRGHMEKRLAHVSPPPEAPPSTETESALSRAWFGGYLFDHYGHFLLEGLSRILDQEIIASPDPIVFFDMMRIQQLRPYMAAIFRHCAIDPARIFLCNAPLRVDLLRVQQPSFEIRGFVRPAPYRNAKAPDSIAPRSGVLYLSRSRLSRLRQIEGEEELERALTREFGAEIVYPETLAFADQIEKLGRAAHVIGCEGSAFHSLIFLRRVPQAIVLSNSLPHMDYLLCDELFDGETVYIRATNEAAELKDRSHWTIDIPRVLRSVGRLLEQGPPGPAPVAATPGSWRTFATNLTKPWTR